MTEAEPRRHLIEIEADSDVRLDSLLAARLDLSRTQAATLIANGRVTVNGGRERAAYRARAGDRIVVDIPPPPERAVAAEDIPLAIVYEDESLLVVDKPAGMVVHPAPGNWSGTLVNALKGRGGELSSGSGEDREGIVHRLDKETSGLLLVAKTDRAHRVLGAALSQRRIVRRYAALAWGHLATDRQTIDAPLARDPRNRKRMAVVSSGRGARTDFVRLARFDACDLLRAHLHTGRTHQIRVHLASIGHPVVGDDTYGGGGGRKLVGLPPQRHFLHAAWLSFRHPATGEQVELRAPLPEDLRRSLATVAEMPELLDDPDPLDRFGFYSRDPDLDAAPPAPPPQTAADDAAVRPLVLCRLGERTYAVDLLAIREIIPVRGATRLPKSPPYVSGLMNVRGTIVTVIDLSRRLGGPGTGADASVVLVEFRGKLVGVAVDEVTEVLRLRPDEIDPPGPEHGAPGVITGVGHSGESIVIILDIHGIIQQVML